MLSEPCPKQNDGLVVQKPQIISMSAQKQCTKIGKTG
jgi:hypothetical protein